MWIARGRSRDLLPKFSLFEHELRSHVPLAVLAKFVSEQETSRKSTTEMHQNGYSLISFGMVAEVLESCFKHVPHTCGFEDQTIRGPQTWA